MLVCYLLTITTIKQFIQDDKTKDMWDIDNLHAVCSSISPFSPLSAAAAAAAINSSKFAVFPSNISIYKHNLSQQMTLKTESRKAESKAIGLKV